MEATTPPSGEILVFTDPQGGTFAIPRDIVEQYRLIPEQRLPAPEPIGVRDVPGPSAEDRTSTGRSLESRHTEYASEARELDSVVSSKAQSSEQSTDLRGAITGEWRAAPAADPTSAQVRE